MKILTLTIIFLLFASRIKNTPTSLSKTLWLKKIQKSINKQKKDNKNKTKEDEEALKGGAMIICLLIELFFIIFYIILGTKIGTPKFVLLSAMQVATCIWALFSTFGEIDVLLTSDNICDFKFHRWFNLINVVIDYIYYPMAIYLLFMVK